MDSHLLETIDWWKRWSDDVHRQSEVDGQVLRSSIVLKALTYAPTGAIIAAPTTSLPETLGGARNWDYRYSWVRDATFSLRALADIGCYMEAEEFRKFMMRSAAGSGDDLQIMYGVRGERRLTENVLEHLEGYRQSSPVRIGNEAYKQLQTDVYGELVHLLWNWHLRGESPTCDYWRFLIDLANAAAKKSKEPDRGLWEIRGEPQHFVHSKVMCWSALDRAIKLACDCKQDVPYDCWQAECDRIKNEIYERGIDKEHGNFCQSYETNALDSALLLLPNTGFVAWHDPLMLATTERIRKTLMRDGLLMRYDFGRTDDGMNQKEGAFLACSFWLVECLAHQGKVSEAQEFFEFLCEKSNDLGLFSEEFDSFSNELLGNFPQGLTHLSHVAAAVAIARASQE
jgi:GH15 family glucan-1,4-alpha-glucosidase